MLFGNMIVAGVADKCGNLTDLSINDILDIKFEHVGIVEVSGTTYTCLLKCGY